MTKARILANIVSTGSVLADGSVAATGITGAVPIASGGTGATTRQDAINSLAGTLTAGHYLRGHDNGVAMSGILAADVPTLNQNTTGSAATLTTPRTISITGDVAYTSGAFDGSADATGVATLSNSGVTAGTYGSDTNIPQLAVDSKGRVTSVTNVAVSIPSGALTFTGDVTGTGSTGATTGLTLTATGTAGTYTKVTTDSKGRVTSGATLAAGDIPSLDASKIISGVIDAARLPSYVDDVVEATNLAGFPATGETGKIYVALDTNKAYRWSGSAYIYITSGAVDSVAGRTGVVTLTSADVGLGSVENKSSATIRGEITSTNVTTALGFTPYNSTNPSGYITSSALSSYLPLSGGTLSGKLTINATAGLDLNRLTFDADGTDSFYRALSGNRHRFTTTGGAEFIIGNASGAVTINGNQVLHAGNYNSYAPTLTGTGASGTWGINVTGYSNYVNRVEAYQWNNATLAAGYNSGIETSFVSAAQDFPNYGVVLSVMGRIPADPGGNFQLFMGHGQSYGGLGLRLRSINHANNAWTSWKILLDESNYTSYAMPAGASATNSVDVRAPVFYDSNDTAYYTDPNSISSMYGIAIRGDAGASDISNQIFFWGSGASTTSAIGFKSNAGSFGNPTGTGDGYNTYLTMDTPGRGWVFREGVGGSNFTAAYTSGWILNNGIWQANASMRAPIFYDRDDTNYYIDAATNSNLAALSISSTTGNTTKLEVSGSTGQLFSVTDSMTGTIFSVNDISGIPSIEVLDTGLVKIAQYSGNVVLGSSADNTTDKLQVNGSVQATTIKASIDARAPLFYDSNDTGYYLDPNGSSLMSSLNVNGNFRANFISGGGGTTFTANHYSIGKDYANGSWSGPHYGDLIIGYHTGIRLGANYSGIRFYADSPTTDANNDGNGDGGEALLMTVGGFAGGSGVLVNNTLTAGVDVRAPIFYDQNNTGYYLDPNSTSRLNRIDPDEIYNYGWFRNHESNEGMYNQATGQHWYSDASNYWNMGGGGINGQGIRFRDNHNSTVRGYIYYDQSNNIGFLNQDGSWRLRVIGGDYSQVDGSSMRAPLYYDSDNTGYYLDLHSNTRINAIYADVIYSYGNITAYTSSDQKFKTNIRAIPNALEIVRAVGGKLFDWTDEYLASRGGADGYFLQKSDFGLVAQDLLPHLPQAVKTRQDGTLAVDYEKLCVVAFEAICTLEKRLAAVEQTPLQQNENTLTLLIETVKQQQNQINELKKLLEK